MDPPRVECADVLSTVAGWRKETRTAVQEGNLSGRFRVLSAIIPTLGYFPNFFNPVAALRGIDEGLEAVRRTPRAVLDRELRLLPKPAGDSAEFEALAGGDAGALCRLTTSMREYYDLAIAPHTRVLESEVERDRAIRLGLLAERGLDGLLASLRPMLDWRDGELRVPDHPDQEIELGGRGLLLVPSVFCVNHLITMFDPSLQPVLVYPIRPRLGALFPEAGPRRGLAALLGPTRAAVLHAIATGRTTTDLARRVGISLASAKSPSPRPSATAKYRELPGWPAGRAPAHPNRPLPADRNFGPRRNLLTRKAFGSNHRPVSVTYGILGPLIVHPAGGGELAVTSPRQRTILAMLLLSANRPVTTSRLVDAVWPHNPPHTAREQVQNCVGLLRRKLRADIERRPSGYRLRVPEDALDALVFARRVAAAERHLATGDAGRAMRRLLDALRLWRGRVLEDVDSAEVASAAIGLQELHSGTVTRYVDLADEFGAGDVDLITELNRWSAMAPLHEGISTRLARALWRSGRSADALAHLRRLREQLSAEFGVIPAPDTQALEAEILASVVAGSGPEPCDRHQLVRVATQHLAAAAHILDRLLADSHERVHPAHV